MALTIDDIKNIAPDRRAFAAAKKVATAAKWSVYGRDDDKLWGKALGSDGSEYAVYVEPDTRVLECSCPSRKRPCKHALALAILDTDGDGAPEASMPSGHKYAAQDRYYSSWE